jgi:GGDEF domain-containing protein
VVVVSRDVPSARKKEREVEYLAYYDSLTGLHNRRFFLETLATLTEAARRGRGTRRGDRHLRGFHVVNDNLGPPGGRCAA